MIVSRERIKEIQARAAATRYQLILVDSEEIEAIAYLAGRYDERVTELLEANNAEVERRRKIDAAIRNLIDNLERGRVSTHPGNADSMPMVDSGVIVRALELAIGIDRP